MARRKKMTKKQKAKLKKWGLILGGVALAGGVAVYFMTKPKPTTTVKMVGPYPVTTTT